MRSDRTVPRAFRTAFEIAAQFIRSPLSLGKLELFRARGFFSPQFALATPLQGTAYQACQASTV
jgi:hypothetical protein